MEIDTPGNQVSSMEIDTPGNWICATNKKRMEKCSI